MALFRYVLTALLLVAMASAHNLRFDNAAEVAHYRRAYGLKHRSLGQRCGAKIQRRRMRRAATMLALTRRQAGAQQPPAANTLFEHYVKRAAVNNTASANTSACLLTPEVTQGPYHVLGELVSQNITFDEPGVPLQLAVDFVDVDTCEPLSGVWVDVWHANATGFYSGFAAASSMQSGGNASSGPPSMGGSASSSLSMSGTPSTMSGSPAASASAAPTAAAGDGDGGASGSVDASAIDSYTAGADSSSSSMAGNAPTDGDHFLRGVWQTDDDGLLTMYTVVPGWYTGRAAHIHLKVYDRASGYRADNGSFIANGTGLAHHTGQWFFDDELMASVAELAPYSENALAWTNATKDADDSIYPYAESMNTDANLDVTYVNESDITYGLIATTTVGINMTYASAERTTAYWDPDTGSNSTSDATTSSSSSISSSTAGA